MIILSEPSQIPRNAFGCRVVLREAGPEVGAQGETARPLLPSGGLLEVLQVVPQSAFLS